jgi:hypothetical protein
MVRSGKSKTVQTKRTLEQQDGNKKTLGTHETELPANIPDK